jgi:peptidoglycan L-alanyl-D-glutamate endopeptidase CwlK
MSRDKKDLHNELVSVYELACEKYKQLYPNEVQPFLTCTHRTNEEQNKLYEIGRTVKGSIVTNAKAGQSPHNYLPSFAFDIAFIGLDKKLSWNKKHFKNFADIVKSITNTVEWGGDWKFLDVPHFELKAWKQFKDIKHL